MKDNEVEIKLPKLGESIVSATVVTWFKKVGDAVKLDEPLLEVSTDKVNSEIPSPVSGVLTKTYAAVDEEVDVGAPLALIATADTAPDDAPKRTQTPEATPEKNTKEMKGVFTPVVLRMAREKGVDLDELERIPATGAGGRLSKRDLELYLANKGSCSASKSEEGIERVKMSSMRKMIASSISRSCYTAPHATLITEVDMTDILDSIAQQKEAFLKTNGYKLTVTSFIAKAIAQGVKKAPHINAVLEEDTILVKKFVNLGIAVNVDQGIVIPVIQGCQDRTVTEIAKEVADLSQKARANSLDPTQVKEGTITMTNFGMAGAQIGIPIIRFPEVAIVGVGAIERKVVPQADDSLTIRKMMHLSLTFDHRVIDGIYGSEALAAMKAFLESKPTA